MKSDLFEDHRKIVAAAEELLAFVRQNPDARMDEISQMRARLGAMSMAHLRAEEEQIIAPLKASGQLDEIPRATAALAAIRDGRNAYSAQIRAWTPQAIAQDRDGYIEALVKMIDHIKAVMAQEEAELYWPALRLLAPDARAGNG